MLSGKAKDEEKRITKDTGTYSRELRNQNVGHLVNLCESNILKKQLILLPVERTNNKSYS